MSQQTLNNIAITLDHFNSGKTVVVITSKQTELYNTKCQHNESMLLESLYNAVTVRLI